MHVKYQLHGGKWTGKTAAQLEALREYDPELGQLLTELVPAGDHQLTVAIGSGLVTIDFLRRNWRLTAHAGNPAYWVAEIHDLNECDEHPGVYIGPISHAGGTNREVVIKRAIQMALRA